MIPAQQSGSSVAGWLVGPLAEEATRFAAVVGIETERPLSGTNERAFVYWPIDKQTWPVLSPKAAKHHQQSQVIGRQVDAISWFVDNTQLIGRTISLSFFSVWLDWQLGALLGSA